LEPIQYVVPWWLSVSETDVRLVSSAGRGCSWKVRDHPLDVDKARSQTASILHELQPFTKYAVYVQTYMILSAKTGARSPILYFTTKPKSASPLYSICYCVVIAR